MADEKLKNVENNILFDYLTCTFPTNVEHYKMLVFILGYDLEDEFEEPYAFHGYKKRYTFGEFIMIQVGGPKNGKGYITSQLEMSGQACREFEENGGSWKSLLFFLKQIDGNFTKLDIAHDVFNEKHFNLDLLFSKLRKLEFSSFSKITKYKFERGRNEEVTENQMYVGSQGSNTCINIYDKNCERHDKNIDTWVNTWIRIEMRFRQARANTIVSQLLAFGFDEFNKYSSQLLFSLLDFKESDSSDKQISRRKTCQWWLDFIQHAEKINIQNQAKVETTITKKNDWLERSARKSDVMVFLTDPDNYVKNLEKGMKKKNEKFTVKDLAIVNKDLKKKGKPLLDMETALEMINNLNLLKKV